MIFSDKRRSTGAINTGQFSNADSAPLASGLACASAALRSPEKFDTTRGKIVEEKGERWRKIADMAFSNSHRLLVMFGAVVLLQLVLKITEVSEAFNVVLVHLAVEKTAPW
jgi:hypothetical protein